MTVLLPSGETVPALGMGTWMMADDPGRRADARSPRCAPASTSV